MANIPVNIDMHILETAEYFPNLLGPLMINDYIQGLQASRRSDEKHVSEFGHRSSDEQLARFNSQRILSSINAGKAYERWANLWFLSGQKIRELFDGIFYHSEALQKEAQRLGVDLSRVWSQAGARTIIRSLAETVCKSKNFGGFIGRCNEFYNEQSYPGALHKTYVEMIRPHMDYCEEPGMFAEHHGNYLESIFGSKIVCSLRMGSNFRESARMLRDQIDLVATISGNKGFVYSWVPAMRPLFDLAQAPIDYIPPTLNGLEGISLLAPGEPVERLESELWLNETTRSMMLSLRYDLYLCYVLSGGKLTNSPAFAVNFTDDVEGPNPFRPTRILEQPYSVGAFWQTQQQAERMVPVQFMEAVQTISKAAMAILDKRSASRSRSAEALERREVFLGTATQPHGEDPDPAPVIQASGAFPLEWGLLAGLLAVALYAAAY